MARFFYLASALVMWWAALDESWAVPPTRAGKPPYETDGIHTWYFDPDNPTRNVTLRVARTRKVTLYRLARQSGVFVVEGSEVMFPGLPTPVTRHLSIQEDNLLVEDQAANGEVTQSWWDVSALTNPFLPPPAKLPADLEEESADKPEADVLEDVRWRHDEKFNIFLNERGESVDGSRAASGRQGSLFVDDANRVFFTPPRGIKLFFPKPADVYEMLTWVDNHRLLGQYVARKFSEYAVLNLRTRTPSAPLFDTGYTPVVVRHGRVRHYRFPKPDDG